MRFTGAHYLPKYRTGKFTIPIVLFQVPVDDDVHSYDKKKKFVPLFSQEGQERSVIRLPGDCFVSAHATNNWPSEISEFGAVFFFFFFYYRFVPMMGVAGRNNCLVFASCVASNISRPIEFLNTAFMSPIHRFHRTLLVMLNILLLRIMKTGGVQSFLFVDFRLYNGSFPPKTQIFYRTMED